MPSLLTLPADVFHGHSLLMNELQHIIDDDSDCERWQTRVCEALMCSEGADATLNAKSQPHRDYGAIPATLSRRSSALSA